MPEVYELGGAEQVLNLPAAALPFVIGFLFLHMVERSMGVHDAHEQECGEHRHHPELGVATAAALALAVIAHDFTDGLNTVSLMIRHVALS